MTLESKVLVVGLGSIGRRHLRMLAEIWQPTVIHLSSNPAMSVQVAEEMPLPVRTVNSWQEAFAERPKFAIVANPTAHHLEAASKLADSDIPFIIEKPVSDRLDGLEQLQDVVRQKNLPVLVGFQLRYHPGYQKFMQFIRSGAIGKPLSLQGHVGQYLPEWREVDYRKNYSASRRLGGGVIFDLCHEIDIAISAMGIVRQVSCVCGQYSDLEIDTEDIAELVLEHENNTLSHIHLNYLEPKFRWTTTVLGTQGSVTWDYGEGFVYLVPHDGEREVWHTPANTERDDVFRTQMQQWLEVLDGNITPAVDLATGIAVTKVAVAAHRAAQEKRRVAL